MKHLLPEEVLELFEHFKSEKTDIKGQEDMDTSRQEEAESPTETTTTSEIKEEEDDDDMEDMSDMEELDTTSMTKLETKIEKLSDKTNSSKYDKYEKPKLKKVLIKRDHQLKKMYRQMKVDQEKHQKTRALFEQLLQKTGIKEEDIVAEGCFGKEEGSAGSSSRTTPTHAE